MSVCVCVCVCITDGVKKTAIVCRSHRSIELYICRVCVVCVYVCVCVLTFRVKESEVVPSPSSLDRAAWSWSDRTLVHQSCVVDSIRTITEDW